MAARLPKGLVPQPPTTDIKDAAAIPRPASSLSPPQAKKGVAGQSPRPSKTKDGKGSSPSTTTTSNSSHVITFEQGGWRLQLKQLDSELSLLAPKTLKSDISYKSSSTPVRNIFELPVPVETPGAHVVYRFATDEFDISFAVFFQGLDGRQETVLPLSRIESHLEPISGDITVHRPGTIILLWDNTYSWFTTKNLSYSVNLRYPSGKTADKERAERARKAYESAIRDIKEAEMKQGKLDETCERLSGEVHSLEEQVEQLQALLEVKRTELVTSTNDQSVLDKTLQARRSHVLPLLLRCLSVEALSRIAAYSDGKDQLYLLNKMWARLYATTHNGKGRGKDKGALTLPSTPTSSGTDEEEDTLSSSTSSSSSQPITPQAE